MTANNAKNNRVTVFGGSGFLGSYVANELARRGFEVLIADINEPDKLLCTQDFVKTDIQNLDQVSDVIYSSDYVCNFAGLAKLNDANLNPEGAVTLNINGHLNILQKSVEHDVKRLLFASSVYSFNTKGSFYGLTKRTSEELTKEYFKQMGLKYTIVRYGSVYGEKKSNNNYLYNLLASIIENKKIEYKGSEDDVREYIHAHDAAKLTADILADDDFECQSVTLTGTERFTRTELFSLISEITGLDLEVNQISTENVGHYKSTAYSFEQEISLKLTANPFIDLGQGIVQCLTAIEKDLS